MNGFDGLCVSAAVRALEALPTHNNAIVNEAQRIYAVLKACRDVGDQTQRAYAMVQARYDAADLEVPHIDDTTDLSTQIEKDPFMSEPKIETITPAEVPAAEAEATAAAVSQVAPEAVETAVANIESSDPFVKSE